MNPWKEESCIKKKRKNIQNFKQHYDGDNVVFFALGNWSESL